MGCDIHMFAEVLEETGWVKVGKVFKEEGEELSDHPYDGRNYRLFALLAGVKSQDDDDSIPIVPLRGIPGDASPQIKERFENYWFNLFGCSWINLKELQEFDWDQSFNYHAIADIDVYLNYKKTGEIPNSWSQGVSGPGIVVKKEHLVQEGDTETTHVSFRFRYSYRDACDYFLENTIPQLERLGDPDKVRIIFAFDN